MISPRPHQELSSSGNSHQNRFFGLVSHPLIGIMWRVLRSQRRLQHVLARASSQAQVAQAISVRSFSGKVPDVGGIPDPMAEMEMGSDAQKAPLFSASAMDFYDELAEEEVEDEHEHDDEEYRRKQEEIQKELDSRTGLVWTDPWEVSEEQWMSSTTVEDLPDWSPEYVSRISQERVKIHPGRCNNLFSESARLYVLRHTILTRVSLIRWHSYVVDHCEAAASSTSLPASWTRTNQSLCYLPETSSIQIHFRAGV
jgi:hypothetical protein